MGTFELIPSEEIGFREKEKQEGLGNAVFLHNTRWFTKVRWIVVVVFVLLGIIGRLIPAAGKSEIIFTSLWLWILSAFLSMANIFFILLIRRYGEETPGQTIKTNLWLQIAFDLLVVTFLVHMVGSTETFVSFTYLFHIALACIFFPPRESILVTVKAAALYLIAIFLELFGVWPVDGFFSSLLSPAGKSPGFSVLSALSAVFIWFVVWYFVSTLSGTVRKRDQQLRIANEQLKKANQEKNQQMLLTTHDLKAPFAGIESNIQLLKHQYWSEVPDSVRGMLDRIDERSRTLRERINAILTLGNLRSEAPSEKEISTVDLQSVIKTVVEELDERIKARRIVLDYDIPHVTLNGKPDNMAELFSNLISNAVNYSHEGGEVKVWVQEDVQDVHVFVSDKGIGIRDDALPHIFEEYYRSQEAVRFNRMSTGLGLAIVKEIASRYRMKIRVSSEQGKGTTFEIIIPKIKKNAA